MWGNKTSIILGLVQPRNLEANRSRSGNSDTLVHTRQKRGGRGSWEERVCQHYRLLGTRLGVSRMMRGEIGGFLEQRFTNNPTTYRLWICLYLEH